MNKQNVSWVTVFVSVALIGLIGIQIYWINNAISLKAEDFDRGVNDALNNVANKLEKTAIAARIKKKIEYKKQGIRYYDLNDNSKKLMNTDSFAVSTVKNNKIGYKVKEELRTDSAGNEVTNSNARQYLTDSINNGEFSFPTELMANTIPNAKAVEQIRLELFQSKEEMVNDIYDELISINVYNNYKPKVDTFLLDSMLRSELLEKGITARFNFTISSKNNLGLTNELNASEKKCDSLTCYYNINLSPKNIFIKPQYLSVFFPNQKNYLLNTMWLILTISAAIILILIISFYYTIGTILKQKKLSAIKNDFISNMTHEFKTPISTISLATEMLSDKQLIKTAESSQRFIKMIGDENKRLSILVESILQTALLDKGEFKLKKSEFNLHQVIVHAIQNIQLQAEQRGGKISTNLDALNDKIYADKVHITNIIFNLMDNAIKYSKEIPELTIRTENSSKGIYVFVKDNGIGINKDNLKKIFEKFFRVSTGNVHNVKGFGLGLSYVKAIAEKHGGEIFVESEPGKGSVFSIFLPFLAQA